MNLEQVNQYVDKRMTHYKEHKKILKKNKFVPILDIDTMIEELEAIQKLTNVIPSRSSQPVNLIEK